MKNAASSATEARLFVDCFICHASEDKDEIARHLADELRLRGTTNMTWKLATVYVPRSTKGLQHAASASSF
jgi:hypothetical protein